MSQQGARSAWLMAIAMCLLGLANDTRRAAADEPPATANAEALKIHLMDGSQITGRLAQQEIEIDTQFGKLTIPVAAIVSLTPGLGSHPMVGQNLDALIAKLGSPVFSEREAAQKTLTAMGPTIRLKLAAAAEDPDTERRTRAKTILEEFDQSEEDADPDEQASPRRLIDRDTIETTEFAIVGKIVPQEFAIASQYGVLNVKLSDIRRIQREMIEKQDLQMTVAVDGNNMITRTTKDTGIRVERGDRVTFTADGTITMTPWGNQAVSTPDGAPNYGWYLPNKIAGGALVGKIGPGGAVFRIGTKHSFTADRTGVLQLAVALQGDQPNQNFPGEYRVKVRVKRK